MPRPPSADDDPARHPRFFEALVEVDTHATLIVDGDGQILFATAAIEAYTGVSSEEIVGMSLLGFVHPESFGSAASAWEWKKRQRSNGEVLRPFELHLAHTGPDRVVEVALSDLTLDDGSTATVLAIRDVTRNASEERIAESVMGSEPIEVTLDLIVALAVHELRGGAAVVAYDSDGDAFGQAVSRGGSAFLAGSCRVTGGDRAGTPWSEALMSRSIVSRPVAELADPVLRAEALRLGYEGCWAVPLDDSLGQNLGCLVIWTPDAKAAMPAERKFLRFLAEIAGFGLDRWSRDRQLAWSARHDPLTGLPNRLRLHEEARANTAAGPTAALLIIDLDSFKQINDDHGHLIGDQVLITIAHRFQRMMRNDDVVCRLGGDEFAVLCPAVGSASTAIAVAERLICSARKPVETGAGSVGVGASIGIRLGPLDDDTLSTALAEADAALYDAKARGGNQARRFGSALP